jgi:hypothetical protein
LADRDFACATVANKGVEVEQTLPKQQQKSWIFSMKESSFNKFNDTVIVSHRSKTDRETQNIFLTVAL